MVNTEAITSRSENWLDNQVNHSFFFSRPFLMNELYSYFKEGKSTLYMTYRQIVLVSDILSQKYYCSLGKLQHNIIP